MAERRRSPRTAEEREEMAIGLAYTLAEKQLQNGTASATVITHFLKLATEREKREMERLKKENLLLEVKHDQIKAQTNMAESYQKVLEAMRRYSGNYDE